MSRFVRAFTVVLVVAFAAIPPTEVRAGACWPPPVEERVLDPFREPACRWCPGNRGIEYATASGTQVRSVAAGAVSYSGTVAGTGYVVVEVAGGLRVTYGNLATRSVGRGDAVAAGQIVGVTAGRLHLGLRDGDRYIDPAPFIGTWRGVVRLVPSDGSPAPPSPRPRLECGGHAPASPVVGNTRSAR